jgi:hypothetical protein
MCCSNVLSPVIRVRWNRHLIALPCIGLAALSRKGAAAWNVLCWILLCCDEFSWKSLIPRKPRNDSKERLTATLYVVSAILTLESCRNCCKSRPELFPISIVWSRTTEPMFVVYYPVQN